jgi:cyclic-di-AMP phosphodiesterase PgpH
VEDRQLRLPAISLSRAALRPNFSFNQAGTEERRQEARDGVPQVVNRLSRGAVIAREGDALNAQQIAMIEELRKGASNISLASSLVGLALLSAFVYLSFYLFAASQIERFARRIREIEAVALITLLLLGIGRILLEASGPLAALTGAGVAPSSFWYLVPFASGAMLVRILVNAETALVWILAGAGLMGLLFEQEVLLALFFAISGAAATAAVSQSRERAGVLRAGVLTGLINGICALLMGLVAAQGEEVGATGPALQSLWDVGFAFVGGLLSGVLTLGLVPVFELMGFVTDYKLLELANLNHPLLRQLMLRAPGTYHHSVTVAQLCEAAAEAIGANALQTRVACYFHDIGKAVQPRFFIENQRGGPNPHEKLSPHASARIIIAHVVDGAAIARQYKLPQPIIDGILMHHGTSLVQYFYVKAVNAAGPDGQVDEADFRYPGELPNSRETGIMMLADKVEAACRTLKDKSPASIRALIQKLINGAITEGQLEKCPLTVQELYRIVDAFTEALLAIYHNRIEYPGIQRAPVTEKGEEEQATGPVITLELQNPLAQAHPAVQEAEARARLRLVTPPRTDPGRTDPGEPVAEHDYESAENQMRPGQKGKG